jgi:hypothetical protein
MTSFGLIGTLVCFYVVFLLGVAGRDFGMSSSLSLTHPVASGPSTTITAITYAQVHVVGHTKSSPTQSEPQLPTATRIVIDTDSLDTSRSVATVLANHPTGGIARPEEDASSKIQAIFFGIASTCIGVASLAIALLTLRAMSKQRQPDPETQPPREEDRSDSSEMELTQHPSSTVSGRTLELSTELDAVETAVEMQCEEPAMPSCNVQATQQPSGTTAVTS